MSTEQSTMSEKMAEALLAQRTDVLICGDLNLSSPYERRIDHGR